MKMNEDISSNAFGRCIVNGVIVFTSIVITIAIIELSYRIKLLNDGRFPQQQYFVSNSVFGEFDIDFGIKMPPKKIFTKFTVTDGKVIWCPKTIYVSNEDGLSGKTTISEYLQADTKILVFGDSFTQWYWQDTTWPDLMEGVLSKSTGNKIRVLNYGVGGYGILQMFDLAKEKILEHKPDLVIFAFITNDLSRNRWWVKSRVINGYERPLLSPSSDTFDLKVASDRYLVNKNVDTEWCEKNLSGNETDPLIGELNKQYEIVKESIYQARGITRDSFYSFRNLYIINKAIWGTPFPSREKYLPRVGFDTFTEDEQFVSRVMYLNAIGTPYLLVHLPIEQELRGSKITATQQESALLDSLESITGKRVVFMHKHVNNNALPDTINLMPYNSHPNIDGMKLYADLIAGHLIEENLVKLEK